MATIQFIVAYVLLMSITIPVMRWVFRAELQEIVVEAITPVVELDTRLNDKMEDIIAFDARETFGKIHTDEEWIELQTPVVKPVSVPKMSYSTATNVLTIIDDNGKIIKFNMHKSSDKALEMIESMVKQADDLQDDAEEALLQIEEEIFRKNGEKNPYRGEGVKSKVKK